MIKKHKLFFLHNTQLLRYIVVGSTTGALFILSSVLFTVRFGMNEVYAIFLSYVLTTPLSFYFQKKYAFRSAGKWVLHITVFFFVTAFICFYNLVVTTYIFSVYKSLVIIFSNWVFICLINYFFYRKIFT